MGVGKLVSFISKGKYTLVLAESSLELIPKELWNDPSIIKSAKRRRKKPAEILLDKSLHYHAMKKIAKREKRGRPDIVHVSLLLALNSPLNQEDMLNIYVHTLENYVIIVNPEVRIPKNYNRFVGLMEQLLKYGKVPPESEKPLLYVKTMSLKDLISRINPRKVILLSEKGEKIRLIDVPKIIRKGDMFIIGGFPHGDFEKETYELCDEVYSMYTKSLETWTILSHILTVLEISNNLI